MIELIDLYIKSNYIEIIGSILGIIYLYFEYKASLKMWPVGIAMSLFYVYIFISSKFYAFATINIYYIIIGIYGWIKWKKNIETNDSLGLRRMNPRYYLYLLATICITFIIVSFILKEFTDSPIILEDSFVTTLSIIAMWMLAHKYVEQWILLIILNTISIFIYFDQMLYPTSGMYFIYTIVSCFGYIRWRKLSE